MAAMVTGPDDWNPPAAIIAAGRSARVTYRNAPLAREVPPQYRTLTKTQLPIGRGTLALRNAIVEQFGAMTTYEEGRRRAMADGAMLDMHQAGRAIDFMVPGNKAKGDAIANFLISIAERAGIQFIVWQANRWSAGQSADRRWAAYPSAVKHRDHPHVELTPDGARGDAPWFNGRTLPTVAQSVAAASTGRTAPFADAGSLIDTSTSPLVIAGVVTGSVIMVGGVAYYLKKR